MPVNARKLSVKNLFRIFRFLLLETNLFRIFRFILLETIRNNVILIWNMQPLDASSAHRAQINVNINNFCQKAERIRFPLFPPFPICSTFPRPFLSLFSCFFPRIILLDFTALVVDRLVSNFPFQVCSPGLVYWF